MKGEGSTSSIQGIQNSAAIAIAALFLHLLFPLVFAPAAHADVLYSHQPIDLMATSTTDTNVYLRSLVTPAPPNPLFGWHNSFRGIFPLATTLAWSGELGTVSFKVPPGFNPRTIGGSIGFSYGTTTTGHVNQGQQWGCDNGNSVPGVTTEWHYPADYDATTSVFSVDFSSQHVDVSSWKCAVLGITVPPYGDNFHPYYQINADAAGDPYLIITNTATSTATTTPPACTENCNSNVLFLPGIEASRLYRPQVVGDPDKRLWEPLGDTDALELAMDINGTSVRNDIYTKTGDVLDEAYVSEVGPNVYKSFINDMNTLRSQEKIEDWSAAPYDWRLSLEDIVTHGAQTGDIISYLGSTSAPYVEQELRRLALSSRTHKVTIIAHSNGGLVAKALMQKLGTTTTAELIDKVIFVASPQVGTPAAIGALLHGEDQSIPVVFHATVARSIAQNMPSVYNLLPSSDYLTSVVDPVISFDTATVPDWAARYGDVIHSTEALRDFTTDAGRTKPAYDDLVTPEVNNQRLFDDAQTTHALLDAWTPPSGVRVIEIAGWGNETLSGIVYRKVRTCVPGTTLCTAYELTFDPQHVVDGDGTVVAPSALWMSAASSTEYWVDLPRYNRENRIEATPFGRKHRDILEVPQLLGLIDDLIVSTTTPILRTYISTSQPSPDSGQRLHFTLHSPLTLGFIDTAGNYTGATATTTLLDVPGVHYARYGDVQWLSVPADMTGQLVMRGTGSGSFTLDIDQTDGNATVATTSFEAVPSGTSTIATIVIDPAQSVTASSTLIVDRDGDGATDMTLHAQEGTTVFPDITPPEIQITFATSTNTIAFIGVDDVDTTTITSATTYPSRKKNHKEPHGIATTTVTARDEAGNTTVLVYTEKLPSPQQRDMVILKEIAYNSATTTIVSTTLSYKWRQDKSGAYKLFASRLQTVATSTESHYRPKRDETVIMTKPRDLDDMDDDDDVDSRPVKQKLPGMMIPYMRTESGKVKIIY